MTRLKSLLIFDSPLTEIANAGSGAYFRRMGMLSDSSPKLQPASRRNPASLSPAERMARFAELQRQAFTLLSISPDGYRRFLERNLRQRRIHGSF